MNLQEYNNSIEDWLLAKNKNDFPGKINFAKTYEEIKRKLEDVHKQVTAGADATDDTSLTWHDESHIQRVIKQASKLLSYDGVKITAYESFVLLVAIQIHDIKNIEGRDGHENRAIEIFNDLGIPRLIDSILLKNIGFVASCHAGSILIGNRKEKDKIHFLNPTLLTGEKVLHLRFLAAVLRLADEYSDDSGRAMSYLLKYGKIKKGSIIHQKHAECLLDVEIKPNSGKVDFDYHLTVEDALKKFPKYNKEIGTFEDVYLLDEIFERTVKSHYETIYCMRYLRPYISISKLNVSIELEHSKLENQFRINYELEERGYPNDELNIEGLCGEKLKNDGELWTGETLKKYILAKGLNES